MKNSGVEEKRRGGERKEVLEGGIKSAEAFVEYVERTGSWNVKDVMGLEAEDAFSVVGLADSYTSLAKVLLHRDFTEFQIGYLLGSMASRK